MIAADQGKSADAVDVLATEPSTSKRAASLRSKHAKSSIIKRLFAWKNV